MYLGEGETESKLYKLRKRDGSSLFGKCENLSVPLLIKLQLYKIYWGKELGASLFETEGSSLVFLVLV